MQVAAEIFDHGPEDLDEDAQGRLGALHGLSLALLGAGLDLLGAADHLQQVVLLLQVLGDLLHVQVGDPLLLDQLGGPDILQLQTDNRLIFPIGPNTIPKVSWSAPYF